MHVMNRRCAAWGTFAPLQGRYPVAATTTRSPVAASVIVFVLGSESIFGAALVRW
jgi:hypothetical protein